MTAAATLLRALNARDAIAADLRRAETELRTARAAFRNKRRIFGALTDAQLRRLAEEEVGEIVG